MAERKNTYVVNKGTQGFVLTEIHIEVRRETGVWNFLAC